MASSRPLSGMRIIDGNARLGRPNMPHCVRLSQMLAWLALDEALAIDVAVVFVVVVEAAEVVLGNVYTVWT
jgi:hypothetical protein